MADRGNMQNGNGERGRSPRSPGSTASSSSGGGGPSTSRGGPSTSRGGPSTSRGGPSTSRGGPSTSRGGPLVSPLTGVMLGCSPRTPSRMLRSVAPPQTGRGVQPSFGRPRVPTGRPRMSQPNGIMQPRLGGQPYRQPRLGFSPIFVLDLPGAAPSPPIVPLPATPATTPASTPSPKVPAKVSFSPETKSFDGHSANAAGDRPRWNKRRPDTPRGLDVCLGEDCFCRKCRARQASESSSSTSVSTVSTVSDEPESD